MSSRRKFSGWPGAGSLANGEITIFPTKLLQEVSMGI
jgi:hypothetical protein